jgi:hypothetical protein
LHGIVAPSSVGEWQIGLRRKTSHTLAAMAVSPLQEQKPERVYKAASTVLSPRRVRQRQASRAPQRTIAKLGRSRRAAPPITYVAIAPNATSFESCASVF